jgi:hypothetical protein
LKAVAAWCGGQRLPILNRRSGVRIPAWVQGVWNEYSAVVCALMCIVYLNLSRINNYILSKLYRYVRLRKKWNGFYEVRKIVKKGVWSLWRLSAVGKKSLRIYKTPSAKTLDGISIGRKGVLKKRIRGLP